MIRPLVTEPKTGETCYIAHPKDRLQRRSGLVYVVGPSKTRDPKYVWTILTITDLIHWPLTGSSNIPTQWVPAKEVFDIALPVLMTIVE